MIAIIDEQAEVLTIPTAREAAEQTEESCRRLAEAHKQELLLELPKAIKYFTKAIQVGMNNGRNSVYLNTNRTTVRNADWESEVGIDFEDFRIIAEDFTQFFRKLGYSVSYTYTPSTKRTWISISW